MQEEGIAGEVRPSQVGRKARFLDALQSSCRRSQVAGHRGVRHATCDMRRTVKLTSVEKNLVEGKERLSETIVLDQRAWHGHDPSA